MTKYIAKVSPVRVDFPSIQFYYSASEYLKTFELVKDKISIPFRFFLISRSIELFLKAFIKIKLKNNTETIRSKYGHSLKKLNDMSLNLGIAELCHFGPMRINILNTEINKTEKYYPSKHFEYPTTKSVYYTLKGYPDFPIISELIFYASTLEKKLEQLVLKSTYA